MMRQRAVSRFLVVGWLLVLVLVPRAAAKPTQEEVFRSIQQNVDDTSGTGKAMPFVLAGAGLVILLAVLTQRRKREVSPRALNHPGKLVKEIMRTVPLRPAELKQLKMIVDLQSGASAPTSPLTLVLCPSVLAKALRGTRPPKMDRKVMIQLARKVGLQTSRR